MERKYKEMRRNSLVVSFVLAGLSLIQTACHQPISDRPCSADDAAGISSTSSYSRALEEEPKAAVSTAEKQRWGVAASAMLTYVNGHDLFSLTGLPDNAVGSKWADKILSRWWDVNSRDELLDAMQTLKEKGHRMSYKAILAEYRKPPEERVWPTWNVGRIAFVVKYGESLGDNALTGWDLARLISLARWGTARGYLTPEEAWNWIMPAAREIQNTYSSWEELGRSYLLGREFWSAKQMREDGHEYQEALFFLTRNEHSPWNLLAWNVDLTDALIEPGDDSVQLETDLYYLALSYVDNSPHEKAIDLMNRAREQGSMFSRGKACEWLGHLYRYEWYGTEKNEEWARAFFEEGARMNNPECMFELGLFAYDEKPINGLAALMWWSRGAQQGSANSLCNLGLLYDCGDVFKKDLNKALDYYWQASSAGAYAAENNISWAMFENDEIWDAEEAIRLAYRGLEKEECLPHYDTLAHVLVKAEHWAEAWTALARWERFARKKNSYVPDSWPATTIQWLRKRVEEHWDPVSAKPK
jgi:TPR repeat protein